MWTGVGGDACGGVTVAAGTLAGAADDGRPGDGRGSSGLVPPALRSPAGLTGAFSVRGSFSVRGPFTVRGAFGVSVRPFGVSIRVPIDGVGALALRYVEDVIAPEHRGLTVRSRHTPRPLDQLPYEPHEFGGFEGLGEEGVDADIESALDLVLRTGTDDGEGKVTGPRIGTQPGGGPETVQTGHHDIEGDDIGAHLMHDIQTLGTIGRGHDLKPLKLEIDPDQLPDDLVVVHNKHPARSAWHNSRVGGDRPPRPAFPHFRPSPLRSRRTTRPARPTHDLPDAPKRVDEHP